MDYDRVIKEYIGRSPTLGVPSMMLDILAVTVAESIRLNEAMWASAGIPWPVPSEQDVIRMFRRGLLEAGLLSAFEFPAPADRLREWQA